MNHPLDGVRQKTIRAEEHLATMRTDIERCLEKCSVIGKRDPDKNSLFHFVADFPAPDLSLSVIIGECLHDLRSALDHIVWQLVLRNNGSPVKENMFPICNTAAGFSGQLKRNRLHGVSVQAKAIIESLQPYQFGQQSADLHPLWVLNQLMNIDKHRTLALAAIHAADPGVDIINTSGKVVATVTTATIVRDGADILIETTNISEPDKVNVQIKTQLFVAFEDAPVRDIEVNVIMAGVLKFIKNRVVPRFEPFFC